VSWRQPRSLQVRQLLAASLGLIAFLALAGYALDRAFLQTAKDNLHQRLENYALAYADKSEFARNGEFIQPYDPIDPRFERPGSGLYAEVVLPNAHWDSHSAQGPTLPGSQMLRPNEERFEGPLPLTQIKGTPGEVYRYGRGFIWSAEDDAKAEFPYTIYILEDTTALSQQVAVFRAALWRYLGGAGLILMLLQTVILRWSLRPLRNVINELKRVQRGTASRMSELHPRELEPLTESINAFIESERENLDRQRNTLADLAHSLKTPLAVLRARLDHPGPRRNCARTSTCSCGA
jgi:two-component system sensor histidine kinase PhoQ